MKRWKQKSVVRLQRDQIKNAKNRTMKILVVIAIIIFGLFGTLFLISRGSSDSKTSNKVANSTPVNNVSMVDGKQVVEVSAKGGYSPRKTLAKAGVPTILRLKTSGTFDCSSAIRIPSLSFSKNLPATGTTDIDLNSPQPGLFTGICSMGMYSFEIDFKS